MTFRWPALEREIRAAVRRRLRNSPDARKESKRFRPAGLQRGHLIALYFIAVTIARVYSGLITTDADLLRTLAAASSVACGIVVVLAMQFQRRLFRSIERTAAVYLPISNSDYFRYSLGILPKNSGWLFLVFIAAFAFGVRAPASGMSLSMILAALGSILLGVAQCLVLVILLLAWRPQWIHTMVALGFFALGAATLLTPAPVAGVLQTVEFLLPPGWITLAFFYGVLKGRIAVLLLLVPAAAVLIAGVRVFRALLQSYSALDFELAPAIIRRIANWRAGDATSEQAQSDDLAAPTWFEMRERMLHNPLREAVAAADLLAPTNWQAAGWIEGLAARWLSPRELALGEYFQAWSLGRWTVHWNLAVKIAFPALILALPFLPLPGWVGAWTALIAALVGLPLAGGHWPAFDARWSSGTLLPQFSSVPVGYAEVSRMIWKANLMRTACWAPFVLVGGWLLAIHLQAPPLDAALAGVRFLAVFVAAQPLLVTGRFSSATNDSRTHFLESGAVIALFCLCGIAYLTLAIFALFVPLGLACILIASCYLATFACWFGYGLLFNRARIDLIKIPR